MGHFSDYVDSVIEYSRPRLEGQTIHDSDGGYAGEIFRMLIDYPQGLTQGDLYVNAVEEIAETEPLKRLTYTCLTDQTAWRAQAVPRAFGDLQEVGALIGLDTAFFNIAANEAALRAYGQPSISADLCLPDKAYSSTDYATYVTDVLRTDADPVELRIIKQFVPKVEPLLPLRLVAGKALKEALDTREFAEAIHVRSMEAFRAHVEGRSDELRGQWGIPNILQQHLVDEKLVTVSAPAGDGYIVGWELIARAMADIVWQKALGT